MEERTHSSIRQSEMASWNHWVFCRQMLLIADTTQASIRSTGPAPAVEGQRLDGEVQ